MKSDERKKKTPETIAEFAQRLFGRVQEMSAEEIDEIYSEIAPGEDAGDRLYEVAERCARKFRMKGQLPPPHVEAALKSTKPIANLQGVERKRFSAIVKDALTPGSGRVLKPVYDFHRESELTTEDIGILDELSKELEEEDTEEEAQ